MDQQKQPQNDQQTPNQGANPQPAKPGPGATISPNQGSNSQSEQSPQPTTTPPPQQPASQGPPPQTPPPAASPGNSKPKKSGNKKWWLIGAIVAFLLLLAGGGYAAYAQIVMPQKALGSYMEQLTLSESLDYELKVDTVEAPEDSLGELGFNSTGTLTGMGSDNFAFDSSSDIEFGSSSDAAPSMNLNLNMNLDLRYLEDTIYARSSDVSLLAIFLPTLEADTWYSMEVDDDSTEEFSGTTCSEEDMEAMANYFENDLRNSVEIEDATRHTWLPQERNGVRVQHYSGTIQGEVFGTIHQDTAEVTSDDCITYEDADESYDDWYIDYNLYTGDDYDEMATRVVTEEDGTFESTLTTSNYDQAAEVTAPEDAQPLEDMLNSVEGFGGSTSADISAQPTQADNGAGQRDMQRISVAQMLLPELETYAANNNGSYPETLAPVLAELASRSSASYNVDRYSQVQECSQPVTADTYELVYVLDGRNYEVTVCLEESEPETYDNN